MRRHARETVQYDSASDSDESEGEEKVDSSSEEEVDEKENTPPAPQWTTDMHSVTHPPCDAHPTVVLDRNRDQSELGYLRCFLLDSLIDSIAANTVAYSQQRRANPPFTTDAPEVWRFIAAHIRMGIVVLPMLACTGQLSTGTAPSFSCSLNTASMNSNELV